MGSVESVGEWTGMGTGHGVWVWDGAGGRVGYRMGDWYRARASPNPIPHVNGLTDRCKNINFGILQNAVDNNGSLHYSIPTTIQHPSPNVFQWKRTESEQESEKRMGAEPILKSHWDLEL